MKAAPALGAAVLAGAALASCGLPADKAFKPLDRTGLTETTTTSTTTTTIAVPEPTTTVVVTTTRVKPSEPVNLYFVSGNQLVPVVRPVRKGATLADVLALLQMPPPADAKLRSALPAGAFVGVNLVRGLATVDVSRAVVDATVAPQEQILDFAQIVLTLTARPGVGQVQFRAPGPNGQLAPIPVPRGRGDLAPVVTRDDYASMVRAPR